MTDSYHQSESQQKTDGWFYATIGLVTFFIIVGIAYVAYQFGQNNTSETKLAETKAINSQIENPSQVNTNSRSLSSNNLPSHISTVNAIMPSQSVPTSRTINGQVFIVTKGRENVKLALVRVCAIPENQILSWITAKKNNAPAQIRIAEQKINSISGEIQKVQTDLQNLPIGQYGYNPDKYPLEKKKLNLETDLRIAELRRNYWKTPEYYFEDLTLCEVSAKTDADGKFNLTIPANKRYAIAATTSRRIFNSNETYWWLVWAQLDAKNQQLDLTNDNLMSENPTNAVIGIY